MRCGHCADEGRASQKRSRSTEYPSFGDRRCRSKMVPGLACSITLAILVIPYYGAAAFRPSILTNFQQQHSKCRLSGKFTTTTARRYGLCITKRLSMQTDSDGKIQTFFPPADRIISIGDVHGDVRALRACLDIAQLVDQDGNWAGGRTHLVQVPCA